MNKTMGMALAVLLVAMSCTDVYGPADVSLELRLVETKPGQSFDSSEGIFSMRDGVHSFFDVFAFRNVDVADQAKEPVGTIVREGVVIQPMPGILVELTMRYTLIEDCFSSPQLLSETDYIELGQFGVKTTSKGCSPPLTPSEQVGDSRPTCLLFDGPEDNGKSMLVRTGPHGTVEFDLVPRLSDPIQSWILEFQVRSGGGAAGLSFPDNVDEICNFAAPTAGTAGTGTGTAAARPGPRFFDPPFRQN